LQHVAVYYSGLGHRRQRAAQVGASAVAGPGVAVAGAVAAVVGIFFGAVALAEAAVVVDVVGCQRFVVCCIVLPSVAAAVVDVKSSPAAATMAHAVARAGAAESRGAALIPASAAAGVVAAPRSVLSCVAVCCRVLQNIAVRCSAPAEIPACAVAGARAGVVVD